MMCISQGVYERDSIWEAFKLGIGPFLLKSTSSSENIILIDSAKVAAMVSLLENNSAVNLTAPNC